MQDLKFSFRQLLKNPGFTAVAVLTLALAIGANLTIFSMIDGILLRPLPLPGGDRLVTTSQSFPLSGVARSRASLANYYDYRTNIKAFASVAMIHTDYSGPTIVGGTDTPFRVDCDRVSPEFFSTLQVPLQMGRPFSEDEMTYGTSHVAVLTDAFWRSYFNADRQVLGRTFQVDGVTTTVIGVLPPNFHFLSRRAQFYTPAASDPAERAAGERHNIRCLLIARLAPGSTLSDARAEVAALDEVQIKEDPNADLLRRSGFSTLIDPMHADHVRTIRPTLLLLEGGVLVLLLVAGVNLVNLLLIRASSRSKELAIRQSLGAGRWSVMRQALTETVVLTLLGGAFGLVLAANGIRLVRILGADQLPLGAYITFDGRLALVAFLGAIALGALLAIPVGWLNIRSHLANALQHESRGATGNRAAQGLRHSFIVAQIALALVLLTGAGMLGISLKRLLETSPGFQADQVFTGQILLPFSDPDDRTRLAFMERLVTAVRSQPGMGTVGLGTLLPFGGNDDNGVTAVDDAEAAGSKALHTAYRNGIVGDYCRVMGIPLVEGRLLEDADNDRKLRVCMVDQAFARRHWPGKSALGHRLLDGADFKPGEAFTVVGVVGTVKQSELADTEPHGTVYYPYRYWPQSAFSLVVRTPMAPGSLVPILRKTVLQLDPQLPIDQLKPMQNRVDESLVARRSPAVIAGIFAAIALLLTGVGTYGVLAYAVSQRQREIGVRMALGALPAQISWQFLSLGLRLLAAGTFLGVIGAWLAGWAMQGLLFNVPALHPATLAGTVSVIAVIAMVACWFPARRASRVDPMLALRSE